MKVITIRDEVYNKLLKLKGKKSFSEVILELIEKKNRVELIKNLKGAGKNSRFFKEVEKEIAEERKRVKGRT